MGYLTGPTQAVCSFYLRPPDDSVSVRLQRSSAPSRSEGGAWRCGPGAARQSVSRCGCAHFFCRLAGSSAPCQCSIRIQREENKTEHESDVGKSRGIPAIQDCRGLAGGHG
ncbi:hypothetical protein ILYODFUR_016458 [Ilyodon furcidens]|uniref:Uncharacterized protein n=1 Tax=Ilyodon furcidens TaxID=33524 RepID=A0ABV0TV69_9TELE